jgi:hypothetical protein
MELAVHSVVSTKGFQTAPASASTDLGTLLVTPARLAPGGASFHSLPIKSLCWATVTLAGRWQRWSLWYNLWIGVVG